MFLSYSNRLDFQPLMGNFITLVQIESGSKGM